jgi:hypothetical protein
MTMNRILAPPSGSKAVDPGALARIDSPALLWRRTRRHGIDKVEEFFSAWLESHEAIPVDGPSRVPGDFPGMIVWVGDIAGKPTMGRFDRSLQQPAPEPQQAGYCRLYVFARGKVVGEREGAGTRQRVSTRIVSQRCFQPGAQDETVHLIEDDLLVFEDRLPLEAFAVEASGPRKISDAKRHDRYQLSHGSFLHERSDSEVPNPPSRIADISAGGNRSSLGGA